MFRRTLLAALALPALARAQAFPTRPIRVIVPFGAGGVIDVVGRIMADPMGRRLGQSLVIENMPGAGSVIGARTVARATPDGYTLLLNGAAHSVMAALYPDLGFDPLGDFAPVALFGEQPFVLAVHPGNPARDLAGFLAWIKGRGDGAIFASTGIGAASHLSAELLKQMAGIDFTLVTYRGTPQAAIDLVAGRADFMIDTQSVLGPLAREGKLRALAVTTAHRSAMLPELPTIAEAGVPGYAASSWQALHAPAGTPPAIVAQIAAAAAAAQADPAVQARYAEQGIEVLRGDPAEAARFIRAESVKWSALLKKQA
jgi:tripartite-type tricarboxylate transporter receptor subunit TctC